jgi:hypothetical protein
MNTQSTQEIVWKDEKATFKFNKAENEFKLAKISVKIQNIKFLLLIIKSKITRN